MALIPVDERNTLKSASEVKSVADNAAVDQQLAAVAYQINTQANTGAYSCMWSGTKLLDDVKTQLEGQGYKVESYTDDLHHDSALPQYVISWNE
mgnify:CR=1 FL=1|jgi:hypothetical protein|nr:MAG TPA: hypothetical protein [Caudoviricetes sp.]